MIKKLIEMYTHIKEEFESVTDFENYSIDYDFDLDEQDSDENEVLVDVTVHFSATMRSKVRLKVSGLKGMERTYVQSGEDDWEEWRTFDYTSSHLWRQLLFSMKS